MKKKVATNGLKKIQLNRETLRALERSELKVIQGGASDLNSCRPCNTAYASCRC
jgi:hypothetical protein